MLSATELSVLREAALMGLSDECDIERPTEVRDGLNRTTTWAVVASNVPCRASEPRSFTGEVIFGGSVASRGVFVIRLPFGTDVEISDRLSLRSGGLNLTVQVTRVVTLSSATVTTVYAEEAH